jgi:hypothetical protein
MKRFSAQRFIGATDDARRFFTKGDDHVFEWDLLSGNTLRSVAADSQASITVAPRGDTFLVSSDDAPLRLLSIVTGPTVDLDDYRVKDISNKVPAHFQAASFSPDARVVAAEIMSERSGQEYLTLYDAREGHPMAILRAVGDSDLSLVWAVEPAVLEKFPRGTMSCEGNEDDCYYGTLADGRRVDHPGGIATSFAPSPEGPLDFVGDARDLLTCRVGPVLLPFDVCEDRVRTKGMLASVLRGDRSYLDP